MTRWTRFVTVTVLVTLLCAATARAQDQEPPVPLLEMRPFTNDFGAVWNADETLIAMTDGHDVHIIDAQSGKTITSMNDFVDVSFRWSPDGRHLMTSSRGWHTVWDALTGEKVQMWEYRPLKLMSNAKWHPDGREIFLFEIWERPDVQIWDTNTGQQIMTLQNPGPVRDVVFSKDGTQVLTVIDIDFWSRWAKFLKLIGVDFPQEDKSHDWIQAWDATTGELLYRLTPVGVYVGREPEWRGTRLLTVTYWGNYLEAQARVEEARRGERDWRDPGPGYGTITIWNTATQTPEFSAKEYFPLTMNVNEMGGADAAWSPDGTRLLTWATGGQPTLWNTLTGEVIRQFEVFGGMSAAWWTPDQTQIVTSTRQPFDSSPWEGTLSLSVWDAETGVLLSERRFDASQMWFRTWNAQMTLVAWHYWPEWPYLTCATSSCPVEVVVTDRAGNEIVRLPHSGYTFPQWNAAGDRLLITDGAGYLRIWAIPDGDNH